MKKVFKFVFALGLSITFAWLLSSYIYFDRPFTEIFQKNANFYQKLDNEFIKNNSACNTISDNYLYTVTCNDPVTYLPELSKDAKHMKFVLSGLSNEAIFLQIYYFKEGGKSFTYYDFDIHNGVNIIKLPEPSPWRLDIAGASLNDSFLLEDLSFSNSFNVPIGFYFVLVFFACILFVLIFFQRKIKLIAEAFCKKTYLFPFLIESSLKIELRDFILFIKNNKSVVFWVIVGGVATFGTQISYYTVSIDFETLLITENNPLYQWYFGTGRNTMGFIQFIFMYSGFIAPWLSGFLSAVLLIFSALTFSAAFYSQDSNVSKYSLVAFSIIFFSLPVYISEFFIFNTHNVFISFGFFFLSISIYFLSLYFKSERKLSCVLALIFLLLSFMTYQSFVQASMLAVALLCVYAAMVNELSFSNFLKKVLTAFILFCAALALYYFINKFFLLFYNSNGYIGSQIRIDNIFVFDKVLAAFPIIYDQITSFFGNKYFGGPLLQASFVLTIFLSVCVFYTQNITWKKIVLPLLVLFVLLGGFLHLLVKFDTPARAYQALIIGNAGIWFLAVSIFSKWRISKWAIYFCAFLMMIYQIQSINRIFYGNYLRYTVDERKAEMIMSRILEKTGQTQPSVPIMIYGNDCSGRMSNVWKQYNIVGDSFFCHGGEMHRPINLINILGYNINGGPLPKDKYNLTKDMPTWPHEKSIKYLDDMIIIKLGEL